MGIATLIQQDLRQIGIEAHVVGLEFRTLIDRVFDSFEYEACVLAFGGGDADPNSSLTLYRTALTVRRDRLRVERGFELLDMGSDVLGFRRGDEFTCVVNMGDESVALPAGDVVLASGPLSEGRLPPDTAVWSTT